MLTTQLHAENESISVDQPGCQSSYSGDDVAKEPLSPVSEYQGEERAIRDTPEKMRPINIREVNKGYIIEIGCHTFAFTNVSDFLPQLNKYIKFPQKIEEAWFKGELFK